MQKVCGVWGNQKLRKRHSHIGTILICDRCGSSCDYYYRKDGEELCYPALWGEVLGVLHEPAGTYDVVDGDEGDLSTVTAGETYYVFRSTDGTIRRARIAPYGVFDEKTERRKAVPKTVNVFHGWAVDVLPMGKQSGQ